MFTTSNNCQQVLHTAVSCDGQALPSTWRVVLGGFILRLTSPAVAVARCLPPMFPPISGLLFLSVGYRAGTAAQSWLCSRSLGFTESIFVTGAATKDRLILQTFGIIHVIVYKFIEQNGAPPLPDFTPCFGNERSK